MKSPAYSGVRLFHSSYDASKMMKSGYIQSSLAVAANYYFKQKAMGKSPQEIIKNMNIRNFSQNDLLRPDITFTIGKPTEESYGGYTFVTSLGRLKGFCFGVAKEGSDTAIYAAPPQYCTKNSIRMLERLNNRDATIDAHALEKFLDESRKKCQVPLKIFDELIVRTSQLRDNVDDIKRLAENATMKVNVTDWGQFQSGKAIQQTNEEKALLATLKKEIHGSADSGVYIFRDKKVGPFERLHGKNIYEFIAKDRAPNDKDFFPAYKLRERWKEKFIS